MRPGSQLDFQAPPFSSPCEVYFAAMSLSSLPVLAQLQPVKSGVYHWADFSVTKSEGRETRKILEGNSAHFEYLEIHATTQLVGAKPKPAHANADCEEVIIVKEGLLKVTLGDQCEFLGTGSVVVVLPRQRHCLENAGDVPLTYYVMKYRAKKPLNLERGNAAGGSQMFNINMLPLRPSALGAGRPYFDRATAMCEQFEMHVTQLQGKGPSHAPHTHDDEEIILVLSGATEMTIDGQDYAATTGDLFLMETQLLHGVRNAADEPCSYFAFRWK